MQKIQVGTVEITLKRPTARHYLNLIHFVKELMQAGYGDLLEQLAEDQKDKSVTWMELLFSFVDPLDDGTVERLAALLLQFDDLDEGVAVIREQGGVDVLWLSEALAINAELADIGRVIANFRRTITAVQGWGEKSGNGRADLVA